MKLDEIKLIGDINEKRYLLTDFDTENANQIGFSEGKLIIVRYQSKDNQKIMYALLSTEHEFLTGIIGFNGKLKNQPVFVIQDVYSPIDQRNKGYTTALYVSLVKKYRIKLLSDTQQTESGKRIWNAISRYLNIQVYDSVNKQLIPKSQVSDDDIYVNEPDRYTRLLAEHNLDEIEQYMLDQGIWSSEILTDYQIYTHPDNIGLYE